MSRIVVALITLTLLFCSSAPSKAEGGPTILFDQGHNQRFLVGETGPLQLSSLGDIFREQGYTIATLKTPMTAESLASADALVISGAFNQFTASEIDAVAAFLDRGGRLAVMLHIGPPLTQLLDRLGIVVASGVMHERENIIKEEDLNFRVTKLEPGPLTQGLRHFSLYGGWALLNSGSNTAVVASTGDKAWIDLNKDRKFSEGDAVQSFAVAVSGTFGKGRFVVFGDDAIFQNQYLDEMNTILATNLAKWLK